ncbi:MAG: AI-2E family transporter [Candidatus Moranbacteria bacterium]|nr:AI-2E family transporter [Candidatus Moranbacteria bacterium]MDD3964502.1 AI-2E family transporter [Candidatus Moranbacteria bacterium]
MTDERITIGTKIALRLALACAVLYFLYLIRSVVFLVLFAVLTSVALSPVILRLQKWKLSRSASVIISYAVVFFGGFILISLFVPLFFSEAKTFLESWPEYSIRLDVFMSSVQTYFSTLGIDFEKEQFLQDTASSITGSVANVFSLTVSIFQNFIHFIGFFFLSLYLSLEEKGIEKFFLLLTPKAYHAQALSIVSRMQSKVNQWLFGQMLLMVIAFVMYYIGLTALGMPYALAIAFFGGVMEILPYIGPVFAAIPAILVGLLVSPVLGISALVFYIIAHQIEAHIIAPQVMKHSAGLNPVVLIIAILIGAELAGPLGIILSVPVTMVLSVFIEDVLVRKQS